MTSLEKSIKLLNTFLLSAKNKFYIFHKQDSLQFPFFQQGNILPGIAAVLALPRL